MRKIVFFIFLATLCTPQTTTTRPYHPSFNNKEFCKDLAILYMRDCVALFAHQLAKAALGMAFGGTPMDIHFGHGPLPRNENETFDDCVDKANLFRIGKQPITVHTFTPTIGGWTTETKGAFTPKTDGIWKKIAIALVGPLSGALAYYFMNTYATYRIYERNGVKWTWRQLLKDSLLDADVYRYLLTNFFPAGGNEGAKIAGCLASGSEQITSNKYYNAAAEVLISFFMQQVLISIHSARNKSFTLRDRKNPLFLQRESVKNGNRSFMTMAHKVAAAVKCKHNKGEDFDFESDTTFNVKDVVSVMHHLLYQKYFMALQRVYVK